MRVREIMGLAFIAVLSMSAVASSSASADSGQLTADGPFTLSGSNEGGGAVNALTALGLSVTCSGSTYKAEGVGGGDIPSGAASFTVTPTFANCSTSSLPATVTTNGCDFVMVVGFTTGLSDQYGVLADLVCPAKKDIVVDIYLSKSAHEKNEAFCTITVSEKHGLPGGTLKDLTNGSLTLGGTFTFVSAEKSGICGSGSTNEGKLDVAVGFSGNDAGGGSTAVSISHN